MDPSYAAHYRDLAIRHWWWRARNDCVRHEINHLLDSRRDAAILDVGCGDGVLFSFLSQFGDVQGIDPDPAVVSPDSAHRHRIELRGFDESFLPGRRYDLILMLDVLEHLEDPVRAVRHAASLLAGDGRLLVTVPAFRVLWTHHDDLNRHVTRFTVGRLRAVVRGAGLDTLQCWYLFHWLFFAKMVERAREWVGGPSPPEQLPGDRLNEALYRLCRLEQRLAGRRVPFGSSLLAIIGRDEARHA
jgi:SAM-dependent methyltransferase